MAIEVVLGPAVALVMALVIGRLLIWFGLRLGVVDVPDDRLKTHTGSPVPLGGAAVLVGALSGLAAAGRLDSALVAALAIVWVIGLADDVWGLTAVTRLLGAAVAGSVLVVLTDTGFQLIVAVFWVIAVVVVVNAVKLIDGLDALAGSVMSVAMVGITWFGFAQGAANPWLLLVILGAIFGFLYWNRPPARLYLGDNGAYVVGLLAVWAGMQASTDRMAGLVAVALIGIPLIDLGVTVFRRGLSGTSFLMGDRDHTYDRLQAQGLSVAGVAFVLSIGQALWVVVIVLVSIYAGDLAAAITALGLGLAIAVALGIRSVLAQR
ncbi:MAG TPA: MraY family glycosyltransferase [Acidimicrobiia bacterium]|nr:MraY family glycosyltransferase [Acidimicrobiia bacterium]